MTPPAFASLRIRLDALGPVPEDEWAALVPLLRRRSLAPGDGFVRAGAPATTLGFVEGGLLRSSYLAPDGRLFVRAFSREGDFVASMAALVSGRPSAYAIEALEPCQLITFSWEPWRTLSAASAFWSHRHRLLLEAALLRAEKRERSLVLDDAQTRYREFRTEFPGLEARLKQYDVASFLGITPVFLSRLRGRPEK